MHAEQGRFDRAVAVLKDAYDAGFDPFERIESDAMASFRSSAVSGPCQHHRREEPRRRPRPGQELHRPLDFSFDFKVNNLDGKPLSLDQFKGKVVVIDLWGTWCKPCREAMPGLIQLYRRHHRLGFDIVGLAFEPNATDPARGTTGQAVRQGDGHPLPFAPLRRRDPGEIPNFHAFPTTMVLDKAGKVRFLVLENSEGVLGRS